MSKEMVRQALDAAKEALPKMNERETVWCTIQGHHLRVMHDALRTTLEQRQEISWQPSSPYNPKRIGWELERTALGDGYYGSAIRAAMDFDCVTPNDMTVLQRYAAGVQKGTDHIRLQEIAMKVYHTALEQRQEPAPQPVTWTDADADAARLALELECLLVDKDIPASTTARWWSSAHEALDLHRKRLSEQSQEPEPYDQTELDLCDKCGWKAVVPGDGCLNCQRPEPVQLSPGDVTVETYVIQQGGFIFRPPNGVRLIHKPTGLVVQCDSDRSQHRNRDAAWKELEKQLAEVAQQPVGQRQEPVQEPAGRTEQQIVDQTEELAEWLMSWAFNRKNEGAAPMRDAEHPIARRCWLAACSIQEMLTNTDPENAVAELEAQPAEPEQEPVHAPVTDSVTSILLEVVPGPDGMGKEVYATSAADVVRKLSQMAERIEELEFTQPAPKPAALNWEPLQDFWRDNPAVDWDELEAAVIAAHRAKQGEQK